VNGLTIAASVISAVIAASIIGQGQESDVSGKAIARMQTQIERLMRDTELHANRFERIFDRLRELELDGDDKRRPGRAAHYGRNRDV